MNDHSSATHHIVNQAFNAARQQFVRAPHAHAPTTLIGSQLQSDQLADFVRYLEIGLAEHGVQTHSLQFLRDRGLQRLLQNPVSLVLRFVQTRLNMVEELNKLRSNDPDFLKTYGSFICPCCFGKDHEH